MNLTVSDLLEIFGVILVLVAAAMWSVVALVGAAGVVLIVLGYLLGGQE
jgi:hypothetical protein